MKALIRVLPKRLSIVHVTNEDLVVNCRPEMPRLEVVNAVQICNVDTPARQTTTTTLTHSSLTSSLPSLFSFFPSSLPYFLPSFLPSFLLFFLPSFLIFFLPSSLPYFLPSLLPCFLPSFLPYFLPSFLPYFLPSFLPSLFPSFLPPLFSSFLPPFLISFLPSSLLYFLPSFLPSSLSYFLHIGDLARSSQMSQPITFYRVRMPSRRKELAPIFI